MQPLGLQNLGSGHLGVGVTLNGGGLERPLSERIAEAVAEASAAGDQSRKDVFAQFADQPKTVVYRHIDRALESHGGEAGADQIGATFACPDGG